jgi:hypothetical protein
MRPNPTLPCHFAVGRDELSLQMPTREIFSSYVVGCGRASLLIDFVAQLMGVGVGCVDCGLDRRAVVVGWGGGGLPVFVVRTEARLHADGEHQQPAERDVQDAGSSRGVRGELTRPRRLLHAAGLRPQ